MKDTGGSGLPVSDGVGLTDLSARKGPRRLVKQSGGVGTTDLSERKGPRRLVMQSGAGLSRSSSRTKIMLLSGGEGSLPCERGSRYKGTRVGVAILRCGMKSLG